MAETVFWLHKKIYRERRQLEALVDRWGLNNPVVLLQSQKLDLLINKLYGRTANEF